jgi:hypothetical protein
MPFSKAYRSIEVTSYPRGEIEGRGCWSVLARLELDDRVKIERGMRVGFRSDGIIFKGKIVGWGERWQVQWIRLLVRGEGGSSDFDLITPVLYVSFNSGFRSLLRRYVSMPYLGTSEVSVRRDRRGEDSGCCARGDGCPIHDNGVRNEGLGGGGEVDGRSIMTVEDGRRRKG